MRRKLAAGNWKMNGLGSNLAELEKLSAHHAPPSCEVLVCPPATLISRARDAAGSQIAIGGQDCHATTSGAHTGDVSAEMLKDAGASHVILGHSERREDHGESDTDVRKKASAATAVGLKVVICVGESLDEREANNTLDIIGGQLSGSIPDEVTGENLIVAYEPIWAIGTGKVPTLDQIGEVHDFIRARLERRFGEGVGRSARLLYGGSVKPDNAGEIFAVSNVDGALVGGASLKADDFSAIISALENA
ncbi:Triosephosphate isomerase [Aliiroseovarius sp. xm-m-379]|uniref:triose-phosphate isomerase n=1 Tax=unclassified Aliiroseovarius TaxID=2623558 RepID=UPI001567C7D3|nr:MULTISPECIES: triose-phosphate isomerase [unclassified Aliiroseovarius]NRP11571.1 Triosephosphate isomerase [Aliiroseovarius sp. xm-d-517]NRP25816.1 Triosephosphate isomerase [Aliiroseovarius sp. xm-m-379]NRP31322.1 Triosephosphate isomerase [Aliiroseovarius sp. xm-m-314]NRP34615.1 Triosephosphate isomerase [Aliiroseovarius sp. xm-a-104]NRP42049.1 Triosephosphate isomerase [Aliiroseovarius sp. xm-m-339-2]